VTSHELAWLLSGLALLHRKPVDVHLLLKQFPPPLAADAFERACESVGFVAKPISIDRKRLAKLALPAVVCLTSPAAKTPAPSDAAPSPVSALLLAVDATQVLVAEAGESTPKSMALEEFSRRLQGTAWEVRLSNPVLVDPDQLAAGARQFGFSWFVPELLRHKRIWRDVLIASLVIQLLALGTPLFTQAIIDKVVVHRTESTLIALGVGIALFLVFTSVLSWVRQYLVLHTGNRVDAVLGSAVMEHIFKLPPLYFQHRPTGVVAARLQGVETIREFLASAAVMLILDLPFLLIFVAIMFFYSVKLTLIVLGILAVIVALSLLVAPLFQRRLNEQFLLGARNQAFVTEYVAGMETVKSLQLEPQLRERYRDYLASFLDASFRTRQLANTYSTYAQALEQLLTLLVLTIGAWIVMTSASFTIGMLVAFQMFASRVSQPMLKLVGLWQQFQQAKLSVERLGDVMNAPAEPYSVTPARLAAGKGAIEVQELSFRYAENLPFLFERFSLVVQPGSLIAIMGPSGAGKSTLAKLLQGFYAPSSGLIRIDGLDHRHLSANELRANFGVVPQETTLFSGTLLENLQLANPYASFEQIVAACQMAEIHATIEALPQGYQTAIGERGAGLSGGQKQRIAIARAILKGPKILIFDEATSSLDLATAESIARTVNQLKGRVTMVFITHALPRALQVDQIVRIGDKATTSAPSVDRPMERAATDVARTADKPEGVV
jgi:ATP-binding cassette, subfamily B, bacterial HlyB/CyaB